MTPRRPLTARLRPRSGTFGTAGGAASLVLHAAFVVAIAWHTTQAPPDPPSEAATVAVEYVNQDNATKGTPAPDPVTQPTEAAGGQPAPPSPTPPNPTPPNPTPPPPAPPPPAPPPPVPPAPTPPPNPYADVPMPPPQPAAIAAAASSSGQPAVNLGDADEDRDALRVTGQNVVSSGPDARFRNMPPRYPREAARRHQQGSVLVLIHITETGEAGTIEMMASSGSQALDDAATLAISKWHFKPAMRDGAPVASVYQMQLNFRDEQR